MEAQSDAKTCSHSPCKEEEPALGHTAPMPRTHRPTHTLPLQSTEKKVPMRCSDDLGEGIIYHSRQCHHVLLQQTQLFRTLQGLEKQREEEKLTLAWVYFCD